MHFTCPSIPPPPSHIILQSGLSTSILHISISIIVRPCLFNTFPMSAHVRPANCHQHFCLSVHVSNDRFVCPCPCGWADGRLSHTFAKHWKALPNINKHIMLFESVPILLVYQKPLPPTLIRQPLPKSIFVLVLHLSRFSTFTHRK